MIHTVQKIEQNKTFYYGVKLMLFLYRYNLHSRHLGQHSIVLPRKEPLREHQLTDVPLYWG